MVPECTHIHTQSAYGGNGGHPRQRSTREELGTLWGASGLSSEWTPLRSVLLHRPGEELTASADWNAVTMLAPLDVARARTQHDTLAQAYRDADVHVTYLAPQEVRTRREGCGNVCVFYAIVSW